MDEFQSYLFFAQAVSEIGKQINYSIESAKRDQECYSQSAAEAKERGEYSDYYFEKAETAKQEIELWEDLKAYLKGKYMDRPF